MTDRFSNYDQRLNAIENTLAEVVRQRDSEQKTLRELSEVLHDLRDLLAAWETTRGAFNLLRALGNMARWLMTVSVALLALWIWFRYSLK
ncbi:hypothetical protein [Iodobacter fluviatilis]|uniref:Uncharacterized protein n=1 Tax=Iodobacter fluviatilis TaxID=537 RepID=A0A7G3GFG8_9NEIS|nr:hypothetical protein [Iodobacter fluviatilis]QBC45934.1 hypothetical protein C1H71_20565 [Iodobacter fluviatilis]